MQSDKSNFKEDFKKRLYKFVLRLIKFIGTLNTKDPICRVITDQLTRSGTSILANYIEGQASSSKKEFTVYFERCLKSTNKSKVWVAVLRDSDKCDKTEANWLLSELEEFGKIFGSAVLKLKGKK